MNKHIIFSIFLVFLVANTTHTANDTLSKQFPKELAVIYTTISSLCGIESAHMYLTGDSSWPFACIVTGVIITILSCDYVIHKKNHCKKTKLG